MKFFRFLFECVLLFTLIFGFEMIREQRRELEESKRPLGALANLAEDASMPTLADAIRDYHPETRNAKIEIRTPKVNLRQAGAVESLFVISVAENTYRTRFGSGHWYADKFQNLAEAGLIDLDLAWGTKGGYRFTYWRPESQTSYTVNADPENGWGYHYFVDETGIIRAEQSRPATESSRPLLAR